MVLGHHVLKSRVRELFPQGPPVKIGAASIDVTVGDSIITEEGREINISEHSEEFPWVVEPGEFFLVSMKEHVIVPKDLSCLFLLKSSAARAGWDHAFAGWIDPCWDGVLTMELKNNKQRTPLPIWPGLAIGQLIYLQTVVAGEYKGRYQHSFTVSGVREEIEYDAGSN